MSNRKTPDDFLNKFGPSVEEQFFSLGFSCQIFSINPNQLWVLMDEAEVRFDRAVDGVLYFNGHTMQTLTEVHNRLVGEIVDAVDTIKAAANN